MTKYRSKAELYKNEIITQYNNGYSTLYLAKKYNTYNTSIKRLLIRNNIYIRNAHEAANSIKKCPFKDNDEYSDYFLGLLLTDGCITYNKSKTSRYTSLSSKDKHIIESFRNFVCPKNKVSEYYQKKSHTYIYSTGTRSHLVSDWLESKGNFVNKSYDCDIYIPLNFNILRGIFDGDGYWHLYRNSLSFGICSKSFIFINKIKDFLNTYGIISYIYIKKKSKNSFLYYLEVHKTIFILKLIYLLYNKATIYLERKFNIGHSFVETLKNKCVKFKESKDTNPEPNLYRMYTKEGAETIIHYLNTNFSTW